MTLCIDQTFNPIFDYFITVIVCQVFFLQVSGRKQWKVYKPVVADPMFNVPRDSHGEYEDNDEVRKELVLEITLGPGDVLYIPRGTHRLRLCVVHALGVHARGWLHHRPTMHVAYMLCNACSCARGRPPPTRQPLNPVGCVVHGMRSPTHVHWYGMVCMVWHGTCTVKRDRIPARRIR